MNALVQQDKLPASQEASSILSVIATAASNPEVDVAKLEKLLEMHERITAKQAEQAFNVAMNQAQSEIGRIAADRENQQTRSMYATEAALDRALRPVYSKHGFSLSFNSAPASESMVRVLCYCAHVGGHTRTYEIDMPADGKGAKGGDVMTKTHATGSGLSYGKRYLLKLIFNVSIGVDDDGNGADGAFVTSDQAAELRELIESTGSDLSKFLAFIQAESVETILAKNYLKAKSALKAKAKGGK